MEILAQYKHIYNTKKFMWKMTILIKTVSSQVRLEKISQYQKFL